jgi:hypothetical protein
MLVASLMCSVASCREAELRAARLAAAAAGTMADIAATTAGRTALLNRREHVVPHVLTALVWGLTVKGMHQVLRSRVPYCPACSHYTQIRVYMPPDRAVGTPYVSLHDETSHEWWQGVWHANAVVWCIRGRLPLLSWRR